MILWWKHLSCIIAGVDFDERGRQMKRASRLTKGTNKPQSSLENSNRNSRLSRDDLGSHKGTKEIDPSFEDGMDNKEPKNDHERAQKPNKKKIKSRNNGYANGSHLKPSSKKQGRSIAYNDDHASDMKEDTYEIPTYLKSLVKPFEGDYFLSPCFEARLIVQLMAEGFLPISSRHHLLPKLHLQRSVIFPLKSRLHISKNVRKKKSKKFFLTVNTDFDGVVKGCHEQHGISWLYPTIVESFKQIHNMTKANNSISPTHCPSHAQLEKQSHENTSITSRDKTNHRYDCKIGKGLEALMFRNGSCEPNGQVTPVRLYSVEVWNIETNRLASGELGYTVGNIYTSLTGFSREESAGSVQLATLGALLIHCGFNMWDLGMDMDYKSGLGAQNMKRSDYVKEVHQVRTSYPDIALTYHDTNTESRQSCKDIISIFFDKDVQGSVTVAKKKNNKIINDSKPM